MFTNFFYYESKILKQKLSVLKSFQQRLAAISSKVSSNFQQFPAKLLEFCKKCSTYIFDSKLINRKRLKSFCSDHKDFSHKSFKTLGILETKK